MGKKQARWPTPDVRPLVNELQATDEVVRGNAVRGLCPCHVGWEVFEQHVDVLIRLLRDRSDVVRAHALHVFEDAVRMQSASDLQYYIEPGEERIGEKRACHFRPMEKRLEARRNRKHERQRSARSACDLLKEISL
jgi:hypothetical protein